MYGYFFASRAIAEQYFTGPFLSNPLSFGDKFPSTFFYRPPSLQGEFSVETSAHSTRKLMCPLQVDVLLWGEKCQQMFLCDSQKIWPECAKWRIRCHGRIFPLLGKCGRIAVPPFARKIPGQVSSPRLSIWSGNLLALVGNFSGVSPREMSLYTTHL